MFFHPTYFMMQKVLKICFSPFLCENRMLQFIMSNYRQKLVSE